MKNFIISLSLIICSTLSSFAGIEDIIDGLSVFYEGERAAIAGSNEKACQERMEALEQLIFLLDPIKNSIPEEAERILREAWIPFSTGEGAAVGKEVNIVDVFNSFQIAITDAMEVVNDRREIVEVEDPLERILEESKETARLDEERRLKEREDEELRIAIELSISESSTEENPVEAEDPVDLSSLSEKDLLEMALKASEETASLETVRRLEEEERLRKEREEADRLMALEFMPIRERGLFDVHPSDFPLIFHYLGGGAASKTSFPEEITFMGEDTSFLPESIQMCLAGKIVKGIYRALVRPQERASINYRPITFWGRHDGVDLNISSGIFEGENLQALEGQVGIDTLVSQRMFFHDGDMLSPDNGHFQIINPAEEARGWFVSVRDDTGEAIVIHWTFLP